MSVRTMTTQQRLEFVRLNRRRIWINRALMVLILLSSAYRLCAQDRPVSQAFYFWTCTQSSTGAFTNADSAPTWTLLKNGTTVVTTGTFTVVGTGTLAGDYYGSLTLNSGSWTIGDTYAIEA